MQFRATFIRHAERMRKDAKAAARLHRQPLHAHLDAVAHANGYDHWRHVTQCRDLTLSLWERLSEEERCLATDSPTRAWLVLQQYRRTPEGARALEPVVTAREVRWASAAPTR